MLRDGEYYPMKDKLKTIKHVWRRAGFHHFLGRIISFILFLVIALVLILQRTFTGPSPSVRNMLTMSLSESSALKFVPYIFLGADQVEQIKQDAALVEPDTVTDSTLIKIADAEIASEKDSAPIELIHIKGNTYKGYLLIVKDPSRIFVGVTNEFFSSNGKKLDELINSYGAIGGINANGFEDVGGMGNGGTPIGLVVANGRVLHAPDSEHACAGFDYDNILHVGKFSMENMAKLKLRDAVAYGPALIINGEAAKIGSDYTGLNPRTAIGQRADGAVLLLVLDGRQADSLGATYLDELNIMMEYGAVNACNLDGGTSSAMYYMGKRINGTAAITGTRALPCAILIRGEEE